MNIFKKILYKNKRLKIKYRWIVNGPKTSWVTYERFNCYENLILKFKELNNNKMDFEEFQIFRSISNK